MCIFRWGFPGKNRRMFFRFLIKDIEVVRLEVKEARRVIYMDIRGQGSIPLTRTDANLTPQEIEQKAIELAYSVTITAYSVTIDSTSSGIMEASLATFLPTILRVVKAIERDEFKPEAE